MRNMNKILVGKHDRSLLGSDWHRWEDNMLKDFRTIGCEGVDWRHLARDRGRQQALVNRTMSLRVL
jgi:hypothetical protein